MKTNSLDFDAQALREKILDLAMRGKLVKQDPNDEPASVLLEKIKAEKAELVKEGKIKKSKALPEITDEEKPFDIPDSWKWVRLGEIGNYIQRGRSPKYDKESLDHPIISQKCVQWNSINIEDAKHITEDFFKKLEPYRFIQKNDILWNSTGTGTVGRLNIVKDNYSHVPVDSHVTLMRMNQFIDSDYIYYFLRSPQIQKNLGDYLTGTTKQKELGLTNILKINIPLPPVSEQSRIAAKIAQLFALLRKVESFTQQYAELQTLLKSKVLDLAMRGKLVKQDPNDEPASVLLEKIKAEKEELIKEKKIKKSKPLPPITDEEKLFEIPDSWEWVRLGEILALEKGSIRRGPFGSSLKKAYFVPKSHNTYKVYEQGNAINHTIDYGSYYISAQKYDELKSFAIRPGDIIISGAGTIGKTYILPPESPEGVINQALIRMRLNNKLITNDFFLLLFKQKVSLLNKKAKGTAIKNMFSIAHMKEDIVWALPPISEQNRIVKQLQEISKMM